MPVKKLFAKGEHCRPLLSATRAELEAYAAEHHLKWIEDESNEDERFARNYLRHQVLPVLQKRWPAVQSSVARCAMHCADTLELQTALAKMDYQQVKGDAKDQLSISALQQLSEARQRNVLRYWLRQLGYPTLQQKQLQAVRDGLLTAREDRMPCVQWAGAQLRRYRDQLYVMRALQPHDASVVLEWNMLEPLTLPGDLGVLSAKDPVDKVVTVRFRQKGDGLKKKMQELGVPPWLRDRVPLIYDKGLLNAIAECGRKGFYKFTVI
jgi:tRNA(Ile)-lysidine synthase